MTGSAAADEYLVVLNDEEQYSIWLGDEPLPEGWRVEGTRGGREFCLDRIERIWTDVRPLSVRKLLSADAVPPGRP